MDQEDVQTQKYPRCFNMASARNKVSGLHSCVDMIRWISRLDKQQHMQRVLAWLWVHLRASPSLHSFVRFHDLLRLDVVQDTEMHKKKTATHTHTQNMLWVLA